MTRAQLYRLACFVFLAACSSATKHDDGGSPIGTDGGNDGGASDDAAPSAGAPSAPIDVLLVHQGDASFSLSWTAATAGGSPIDHYKIYRNGVAYATSTTTSYTDTKAPLASAPTADKYNPSGPATTYRYDVSAVDTSMREGPKADQQTAWVYHNGTFDWSGEYNFGAVMSNYADTTGMPADGTKDVAITNADNGGWQPFSGTPFLDNTVQNPGWWMEIGAFNYMTIDLKPTKAGQTWNINVISRAPPGDLFNSAAVTLPGTFGPAPEVGKWATYKIPFLVAGAKDGVSLEVGTGQFVGSISGTTLTVTSNVSGLNVQGASWLSGTGIAPNTYLVGPQNSSGGPGTYQVSPSQNAASTTITAQRTNMYKFSLIAEANAADYFVDNVAFTVK